MHRISLRFRHIVSLGVFTLLMVSYLLLPASSEAQTPRPTKRYATVQVPMFKIDTSALNSRIVGGTIVTPNEFPWQVMLDITFSNGKGLCGGSIIMRQYVLTAAHCVTNDNGTAILASRIKVYAGAHNRRQLSNPPVQSRTGAQLFVHGSYNPETEDYDIAVIKLNTPLTINAYVKPIRLAKGSETNLFLAGNDVTVSGWGTTSYGGSTSNYLRKTTVDIVGRATCNRMSSYGGSITGRMLCAARTNKDSCQGDSGGPLFLRHSGMYKQVGVVSWGVGCAESAYPGVYAHVGVLRNWVGTKVPSLP